MQIPLQNPKAAGAPYTNIDRDAAIKKCTSLGSSHDLISNTQWQFLARNIYSVTDNWSNGRVGSGQLNQGHSDGTPDNALAANINDTSPCEGTGNSNCDTHSHADFSQKRTHTLSNGEVVWDVAGNVWEWVKDDNSTDYGADGYISELSPLSGANSRQPAMAKFGHGTDTSSILNSDPWGGLGHGWLNYNSGAILRGGSWVEVEGQYSIVLNERGTRGIRSIEDRILRGNGIPMHERLRQRRATTSPSLLVHLKKMIRKFFVPAVSVSVVVDPVSSTTGSPAGSVGGTGSSGGRSGREMKGEPAPSETL